MINAIIYARYSTEMQSQGHSIEGQILACQKYAEKNNFNVVDIYIDEATTGQSANRNAYQRIIADAKKGIFQAVIVHALSRTTRFQDLFNYYWFKNELNNHNITIHSTTENIQDKEVGELIEFISIWQAKNDIKKIVHNVMRSLTYNASLGKFNGGRAPLGYSIDAENNYQICESEAIIIRLIFSWFAGGMGYTAIADKLMRQGFQNKDGKPISRSSIREILLNKKYIGIYEYNRTPKRDKNGKRNYHARKDMEEIIVKEGVIPAIVEESLWRAAQSKIISNKHTRPASRTGDSYLLSGLVICGECGSSFAGKHSMPRDIYYYECLSRKNVRLNCKNHSIQRNKLEEAVLCYMEMLSAESTKNAIKKWLDKNFDYINGGAKEHISELTKNYNKLKKQLDGYIDKLLDFDSETLRNKIRALELQVQRVKLEKDAAETQFAVFSTDRFGTLLAYLDDIKDIRAFDKARQKCCIKNIINKIIITPSEGKSKEVTIISKVSQILGIDPDCVTRRGAESPTHRRVTQITEWHRLITKIL